MSFRPRPGGALTAAIALWVVTASGRVLAFDDVSSAVVAVLAPHESRLADEIRRELESSKFEVLSADLGARPWQDVARIVDGGRLHRGVAIESSDRTLTVYTRQPGNGAVDARLILSVDPADRMARRHACLSVVEFLHALSESEPAAPVEPGRSSPGRPQPPSRDVGSDNQSPGQPPRAGAAPDAAAVSGRSTFMPMATPREAAWQMGVGTTFDIETGPGEPTSHLQFLARVPFGPHIAICARVLWPLLAAQFRNDGNDVRAWTFDGNVSLQYSFVSNHRLRPFLGLAIGTRVGLSETTPLTASQSGQAFTTSGTFGIEAGVRYPLGAVLQMFFQVEATRNWLLPPDGDAGYESAAANGETARAAVGILFDS